MTSTDIYTVVFINIIQDFELFTHHLYKIIQNLVLIMDYDESKLMIRFSSKSKIGFII